MDDKTLIDNFKQTASEFEKSISDLDNLRGNVPDNLLAEYDDLSGSVFYIRDTLSSLTRQFDGAVDFVSNIFSFNGADVVRRTVNKNPSGLGLIPLVPIALISGAVTLMGSFIKDVYIFNEKINEQRRLESSGVSPKDAAKIIKGLEGENILQSATGLIKPVALAVGGLLAIKLIKDYAAKQ